MKLKKEWIVIILLAVASLIYLLVYNLLFSHAEVQAEIYEESRLVLTVDLKQGEERSFSLPGKENVTFQIFVDGSIAFVHSDCPDQVCVRAGRLRMNGQSAACLPNGLILKLTPSGGRTQEDLDMVIGAGSLLP